MSAILALEWSTRRVSAALDCPRLEKHLFLDRFHAPDALALLESLLTDADVPPSGLSEIRVGRGPGNYSGIRLAFAWAIGAAAPGHIRLRALSSGAALAQRLQRTHPSNLLILGDARRGMGWGAEFPPGFTRAHWQLLPPAEWTARAAGLPAHSAEPERLPHIPHLHISYPTALDLLDAQALEEAPLEPLYLHPPVG